MCSPNNFPGEEDTAAPRMHLEDHRTDTCVEMLGCRMCASVPILGCANSSVVTMSTMWTGGELDLLTSSTFHNVALKLCWVWGCNSVVKQSYREGHLESFLGNFKM